MKGLPREIKTGVHDGGVGWVAHIGAEEAKRKEKKQSLHGKEVYDLV